MKVFDMVFIGLSNLHLVDRDLYLDTKKLKLTGQLHKDQNSIKLTNPIGTSDIVKKRPEFNII